MDGGEGAGVHQTVRGGIDVQRPQEGTEAGRRRGVAFGGSDERLCSAPVVASGFSISAGARWRSSGVAMRDTYERQQKRRAKAPLALYEIVETYPGGAVQAMDGCGIGTSTSWASRVWYTASSG